MNWLQVYILDGWLSWNSPIQCKHTGAEKISFFAIHTKQMMTAAAAVNERTNERTNEQTKSILYSYRDL